MQSDGSADNHNFGFFFARSSPSSVQLFARAAAAFEDTGLWDQAVYSRALRERQAAGRLRLRVLPVKVFAHLMVSGYAALYNYTDPAAALDPRVVLLHMTCAENNGAKGHLARVFGLFRLPAAYCRPGARYVALPDAAWAGTLDHLRATMDAALAAARARNASLVPPKYVAVDLPPGGGGGGGGEGAAASRLLLPFFRVFDLAALEAAQVPVVEYNFVANAQRVCPGAEPPSVESVDLQAGDGAPAPQVPGTLCKTLVAEGAGLPQGTLLKSRHCLHLCW